MSRNIFGTWGLGLSPRDFGAALAALGVRLGDLSPESASWDSRPAYEIVQGGEESRIPWRIHADPARLGSEPLPDAATLAREWDRALDSRSDPNRATVRLRVNPRPHLSYVAPWIIQQLTNFARADAVSIDEITLPSFVHWSWPLQVGVLPGPGASIFKSKIEKLWSTEPLTRLGELTEDASGVLDILLCPYDLRESLQRLLNTGRKFNASFVAVLGGFPEAWERAHALATSLAHETGSQGVCLASVPERSRSGWFESLMRAIAHDKPLDLAVMAASRTLISKKEGRFPVPCFFASDQLLAESRLSRVVRHLGARASALADAPVDVPEHPARVLSVAPGRHPGSRVGARLSRSARGFAFLERESDDAGALATLGETIARAEAERPVPIRDPRWIQTQLLDLQNPTAPSLVSVIEAGKSYGADVRIGPSDSQWLSASGVFPDSELPKNQSGYWLQVVFSEPRHAPQPQTARFFLPPQGASTVCRFFFRPVPGYPEFQARIIVLYENRALQTALLEGRVAAPGALQDQSQVALRVEDAVRVHLSALEYRRSFDASVLINHTAAGETMATSVQGDKARLFSLQNMEDAIGKIRQRLSEIADDPASFRDIHGEASVELLRFLAHQGRTLYDAFEDQMEPGALARIERLQVVSALPESFLPLELLYEKPAPGPAAGLCPQAKKALKAKAPKSGICKQCPVDDDDVPAKYICPLGFWSMTRVIERHANRALETRLNSDEFALVAEPVAERKLLPTGGAALCGASSRVRAADAKSVLTALNNYTGNRTHQVTNWADWRAEIGNVKPSLLVIMCHTLDDPNLEIPEMEIGGDTLLSTLITRKHVRASQADSPPVVLLLGCESLCLELPFQGFVPYLRRGGAAIILTTIASVLGRHVAPVAKTTVSLLRQELRKKGVHTFGELMPVLRRKALAQGIPMVFALAAYGDADWQLTV